MQFCPKCDNILNINRTAPKIAIDLTNTPSNISDSAEQHNDGLKIEKIINLLTKTELSEELYATTFDVNEITKHKNYTNLNEKEKELVLKNIEKITNVDQMAAYKICKNCLYYEKISGRTLIASKISKDTTTVYDDTSKYKYMIYDSTVPHTRNYICINKTCDSHKDPKKRDAIWFRPIVDKYQTYYVCCECKTHWQTS